MSSPEHRNPLKEARDLIDSGVCEEMTASEFAEIRSRLGWTQRRMSMWLGVTEQMINGYEGGRFPIGPGKANHLRLTALCRLI